jgi:hypothetical protein
MVGFITHSRVGRIVLMKAQLEGNAKFSEGGGDVSKYQGYAIPSEIILRPVDGKSYGRAP